MSLPLPQSRYISQAIPAGNFGVRGDARLGPLDLRGVFAEQKGRERFARDVRALLERTWTDGIDLDWEYPAVQGPPGHLFQPVDRHNFTLLVRELRTSLGSSYEISFAAGGTDECLVQGFEWDSLVPLVDRVHIMSYDLVHGYSDSTGHHTPLFSVYLYTRDNHMPDQFLC